MRRPTILIIVSLSLPGVAAHAATHGTLKGTQYSTQARISLSAARAAALKARAGIITDQELEKERGGSGLRYSFDIKDRRTTYEVGIDARTGALLENSKEGPHPD